MGAFDELKNKGEKLAADHPEQTEKVSDQATDKAGDTADRLSGGKHAAQVDTAQQKADDAIGE
jgi:antitoxin protein of toxin-antitoxin system